MNTRANMPSKWTLISLTVILSMIIVLLGYLYLTNQIHAIRESSFNQLSSIARLKVDEITEWRQERMGDLKVASESPLFHETIARLIENPDDSSTRQRIVDKLDLVRKNYGYEDCILALPDGALLLSLEPQTTRLENESIQLVQEAARTREWLFGRFFRSEFDGRIYIDLAGPVLDSSQQPNAVLLLRVDPEHYLFPLIQSWPTSSPSAETLIVRRDGDSVVFLNTLRHKADPPLTLKIPLTSTEVPAVMAVKGAEGEVDGIDYRGEKVFAVVSPIPGSNWYMVSKIDQHELSDEIFSIGRFILMLVVLGILLTTALLVIFFNNRQRILYQTLYESEQDRLNTLETTRTILYSIGDGVIATNDHSQVTHFNPVAEQLTGWDENDAAGKDLSEVFPIINEDTRQPVENPVERVLREGVIVGLANHTLLIRKDGKTTAIADSGAPVKDSQGKIQGVVLVFRDQTREREAQRERAILTRAISSSLDEIYIFDAATLKFLFVNKGALDNLHYSMDEMREMTPLDIKPEIDSAAFEDIMRPLKDHSRQNQVFETVHKRRDGSRYPVEVHLQLFEAEGLSLFMAIIQDITRRREIESEIRTLNAQLEQRVIDRTIQLEASNRELEAFAYSISHDLRAPLRGIDGWSQALLEDNLDQLDENGRQYLERVRSETQRMGAMIDDLLNLSRVTRSEMELKEIDLSAMARTIFDRLQDNGDHRQVEMVTENGLTVRGDSRLLEIMLTNLLDNAWKFTSKCSQPRIEFGCTSENGRQVFFVRDNGVGFDMKYSSKLFGAFQRLHKQSEFPGIGIGLATVQRIIRRHGGDIWYDAKPDQGAAFFFTLWEAG